MNEFSLFFSKIKKICLHDKRVFSFMKYTVGKRMIGVHGKKIVKYIFSKFICKNIQFDGTGYQSIMYLSYFLIQFFSFLLIEPVFEDTKPLSIFRFSLNLHESTLSYPHALSRISKARKLAQSGGNSIAKSSPDRQEGITSRYKCHR